MRRQRDSEENEKGALQAFRMGIFYRLSIMLREFNVILVLLTSLLIDAFCCQDLCSSVILAISYSNVLQIIYHFYF